ncbi:alkaline phosphatase family protein [Vulcanisaeta sp. JCM 14467]|uniref:alkaline phosphatase family protein n=1 Tax=Vulcanisaeta sp. JCM 14467 TaxID=1295370 RepID=UPI0006CFE56C|nr:alkaline phosphatase family protein [Vulcanisaeta sp. JCM 14467]
MGIYYTKDPAEGYIPYHADWNYGKMNGWLWGSGPQSLYYYTIVQVAPLWDLAEEYGLADNYFTPYLSESAPNHLFLYAAYSPVIDDYGPPPYIPIQESIFAELCQYHVSWGYYIDPREPSSLLDIKYFYGINKYSSHIQTWGDFISEVLNGSLPAVSWVMPNPINDMGPPNNILYGEAWLLYIINTVEESPIWNSTVIFITWDEFGGYYDHVPPPIINGEPLGVRVPLIVISPYAKEDYVSHTLLTHASLIAFIDYNWGLPALNEYVLNSNIPLDFFYFNMSRRPIIFNESQGFPLISNVYSLPNASNYGDLSNLFPLPLQIPLNELPYSRYGFSNITLAELGSSVYVSMDVMYVPIIYTPLFLWLIIALIIDLAVTSLLPVSREVIKPLPMKMLSTISGSVVTASIIGLTTLTTGFLNYVGNTGEAPPLLMGYLIGLILFSIIGFVLIRVRYGQYMLVTLSVIIPALLYVLIYVQTLQSFLMSVEPLLIYGLLSAAPTMLIELLFLRLYVGDGAWSRGLAYSILTGLLTYVIILIIAFTYIKLYQPGLSTLLLPTELVGLALTAVWFVALTRNLRLGVVS